MMFTDDFAEAGRLPQILAAMLCIAFALFTPFAVIA